MSRRANGWDNAPMKRFFKTLKVGRICRIRYEARTQACLDIVNWIEGYFNRQRLHSSADYHTPAYAEELLLAA